MSGSLSKLSEWEIQQLLCNLAPVSQPVDTASKLRTTEDLTRLLTPIIEDCVKRNIEGLLSTLTEKLSGRQGTCRESDSSEVEENIRSLPSSSRQDSRVDTPPDKERERRVRPGTEEIRDQLGNTLTSLGLHLQLDHLATGLSLQDFYLGESQPGQDREQLVYLSFRRQDERRRSGLVHDEVLSTSL